MPWYGYIIIGVGVQVVLLPFYVWLARTILRVEREGQADRNRIRLATASLETDIAKINERCKGREGWIDGLADQLKATNRSLHETNRSLQEVTISLAAVIARLDDDGVRVRT